MDYTSCLNNIIGITRSDCSCITDLMNNSTLATDWYKQSASGIYLDELEGVVSLFGVSANKECADTDLANFFVQARQTAVNNLLNDFIIQLQQKFKEGVRPYLGLIASKSPKGAMAIESSFAGIKLWTVPMKGGVITINKLYAMMNATASFTVYIYKVERDALEYELVTTIPNINSVANQVTENILAIPVDLPLSEYGCDYYLLYQPNGFQPRYNDTSCGCGAKEFHRHRFTEITGVMGDDVSMMPYFTGSTGAMGLAMEVTASCNARSILCAQYHQSTPSASAIAYGVQFKAGELIQEYVLKSPKINQYTMSSREYLWGKRNHFRAEYMNIINWLADNADIEMVDCFVCNDKRITKGGILA